MPSPRSTTRPTPTPPPSKRPGRNPPAAERDNARARKREALERFVEKNAKILAELAK